MAAICCVALAVAPAAAVDVEGTRTSTSFDNRLLSISCVSTSLCRATVRSGLLERWNGHTWRPGFRLSNSESLAAISCPTANFCAAVQTVKTHDGGHDYRPVTRNGDGTWDTSATATPVPDNDGGSGPDMSCTGPKFCMFVNSGGDFQRWDGTSWTSPQTFQGESTETLVSCASPTMCKATDDPGRGRASRPVYSWNGSSWSTQRALYPSNHIRGLDCPTTSFCMLIIGQHYLILSGTRVSANKALPAEIAFDGLSCTGPSFCLGVNGGAAGSIRWDGAHWHGPHRLRHETYLIPSCSSPSFCIALSFRGDALDRVGGTWQPPRRVE